MLPSAEFGKVDILINNAGLTHPQRVLDVGLFEWRNTLDVNLLAPLLLTQCFAPGMIEQRSGKIVNITSRAGLGALEEHAAYSVSKAGLQLLTMTMAVEFGPHNIQTNAIAPTVIATPMAEAVWTPGPRTDFKLAGVPMGRFGKPHEVAERCAVPGVAAVRLCERSDSAGGRRRGSALKALILNSPLDLAVRDIPDPGAPGPGDVRVSVRSVGICGSDVHYYEHGRIGDFVLREPMVLGHEAAGVVDAVGEGVESLSPGDAVAMEPGVPCGACRECRIGRYNLCKDVRFWATPPHDGVLAEYVIASCCADLPATGPPDNRGRRAHGAARCRSARLRTRRRAAGLRGGYKWRRDHRMCDAHGSLGLRGVAGHCG